MNDGFIYPAVNKIVTISRFFNFVESFKFIAKQICLYKYGDHAPPEKIKKYCNFAIDIYQLLKWLIVIYLWTCCSEKIVIGLGETYLSINTSYFAWYLISSNAFTYFYYHVWGSPYVQLLTRTTMNRRFMNTILAIGYYIFAYAYLYEIHYASHFSWPDNKISYMNAFYLSVSNALTFSHDGFESHDNMGRFILISQAINTFIFLTIIISNSVPNPFKEEE